MKNLLLDTTFKDNFNQFLKENGIYLAIALAVTIAFVIAVIIFNRKK